MPAESAIRSGDASDQDVVMAYPGRPSDEYKNSTEYLIDKRTK